MQFLVRICMGFFVHGLLCICQTYLGQGLYSACPPSISWTAPEVLEHPNSVESEGYITTAADVYSYAVVMWELVMCEEPYEDMNTAQEVGTALYPLFK